MKSFDIVQVIPNLFVGAAPSNLDIELRRWQMSEAASSGIGLVVDCRAGADDSRHWNAAGVRYLNLGVEDSGEPLPREFFTAGVEAVNEHWATAGSGVLIHCQFGVARSPSLVFAALLMEGLTSDAARETLRAARAKVSDRYFANALDWWQWYCGGSDV